MFHALKNGFSLVVVAVALSAASTAAADSVICKENGSGTEYKLDFTWKKELVDISTRNGSQAFKKQFKAGTAVRNNPQDKSFIAEGTAKQFVGSYKGCGAVIETLYFDVTNGTAGVLQKTGQFVSKSSSCKISAPAPDLSMNSVEITCRKA